MNTASASLPARSVWMRRSRQSRSFARNAVCGAGAHQPGPLVGITVDCPLTARGEFGHERGFARAGHASQQNALHFEPKVWGGLACIEGGSPAGRQVRARGSVELDELLLERVLPQREVRAVALPGVHR